MPTSRSDSEPALASPRPTAPSASWAAHLRAGGRAACLAGRGGIPSPAAQPLPGPPRPACPSQSLQGPLLTALAPRVLPRDEQHRRQRVRAAGNSSLVRAGQGHRVCRPQREFKPRVPLPTGWLGNTTLPLWASVSPFGEQAPPSVAGVRQAIKEGTAGIALGNGAGPMTYTHSSSGLSQPLEFRVWPPNLQGCPSLGERQLLTSGCGTLLTPRRSAHSLPAASPRPPAITWEWPRAGAGPQNTLGSPTFPPHPSQPCPAGSHSHCRTSFCPPANASRCSELDPRRTEPAESQTPPSSLPRAAPEAPAGPDRPRPVASPGATGSAPLSQGRPPVPHPE